MFIAINIIVSLFFVFMVYIGLHFRIHSFVPLNLLGLAGTLGAIWMESVGKANKFSMIIIMLALVIVLAVDFFVSLNRTTELKILNRSKNSSPIYLKIDSTSEFYFLIGSRLIMQSGFTANPNLNRMKLHEAVELWVEGNILFLKDDPEGAIEKFKQSLNIAPNSVTYLNLSGVYLKLNKNEAVIKNCNNALRLNKNLGEAWLNLGIALERLNDFEQAFQCLDHAENSHHLKHLIELFRGNLNLKLGQYSEALTCYNCAIKEKPNFSPAWFQKGLTLSKLQNPDEAVHSLAKTIQIDPANQQAYYFLGNIYSETHKYAEAVRLYEKALSINPAFCEAWNNKGIALCKLNRQRDAIKAFEIAIEIKPDYFEAWLNQALALESGGFYERAIFSYQKFLKLAPDSMKTHCIEAQQRIRIVEDTLLNQFNSDILESELLASVLKSNPVQQLTVN
jgi:tetratricopeptide (TPR) repeat protein